MSVCFQNFIPRSRIYRDMAVAAFLSGLYGWMFGSLGWSSGPAKLVGWPLQLKSGTAADFTCKLCLKNKTQRQSHIALGYFWVQYHFAHTLPLSPLSSSVLCMASHALALIMFSKHCKWHNSTCYIVRWGSKENLIKGKVFDFGGLVWSFQDMRI